MINRADPLTVSVDVRLCLYFCVSPPVCVRERERVQAELLLTDISMSALSMLSYYIQPRPSSDEPLDVLILLTHAHAS